MLIKVRSFLTKQDNSNPVPLRTMQVVEIIRQTSKAIQVKLQGTSLPQSECLHCGRTIKHPQSLYFGIGSTCITHFPGLAQSVDYSEIETSYHALKANMEKITWEGWLPKSCIEFKPMPDNESTIFPSYEANFSYQGKNYYLKSDDFNRLLNVIQNGSNVRITKIDPTSVKEAS